MATSSHLEKLADLDLEDITTEWGTIQVGTIEDIPQVQVYFGESEAIVNGFLNGSLYVDYKVSQAQAYMILIKSVIETCLMQSAEGMTGKQMQVQILAALRDATLMVEAEDLELNAEP